MKILYLAFVVFLAASCAASFSKQDKTVIYNQPAQPARILLISNKQDSLFLRKTNLEVKNIKKNKHLPALIEKMKLTLEASQGVGIAATQIGVNKKVFLFKRIAQEGHPVQVAINPRIVSHAPQTVCFERDGCLSIPGWFGTSQRYPWVEVEYYNEKGEKITEKLSGTSRLTDFTGVIFQHEYDHTQGVLFIDKLCVE
jgi:peptide deformylase